MATPATSAPAPGPAPAGVDPSADLESLQQSLDDIRGDLRRWTAAVGAVATAVLTGVGWSQADRLFPLTGGDWVKWLAGASAGAAILASVYILVSLYAAQSRILIGTEREIATYHVRFRWREKKRHVLPALADQARMAGARELTHVDLRAQRLDRIATRLELEGDREWLAEGARRESNRLNAYVGLAELRVILMLLERRARRVTTILSLNTVALLVAALGIAGLFTAANYSHGAQGKPRPSAAHTLRH